MISICANCGYHVTKVVDEPKDRRYKHTTSNVAVCALPPNFDGWRKNAVVTTVKSTAEWSEYRQNIRTVLSDANRPAPSLTETIRLVLVNQEASGVQRQAEAVVALLDDGGWLLRDG